MSLLSRMGCGCCFGGCPLPVWGPVPRGSAFTAWWTQRHTCYPYWQRAGAVVEYRKILVTWALWPKQMAGHLSGMTDEGRPHPSFIKAEALCLGWQVPHKARRGQAVGGNIMWGPPKKLQADHVGRWFACRTRGEGLCFAVDGLVYLWP